MARGRRTPANPGRANINLGGILGAAVAGSDNPSYLENAPANTPDVSVGDDAETWQNFMDTGRDNKYLTAGGVLTSNPASDNRNWAQRVTGKPDIAGTINANLLAQRASMPFDIAKTNAAAAAGTKSALDAHQGNALFDIAHARDKLIADAGGDPTNPQHVALATQGFVQGLTARNLANQLAGEKSTTGIAEETQNRPSVLATSLNKSKTGELASGQSLLAQGQPGMQDIVNKSALGAAAMPAIEANNKSAVTVGPNETRFQPAVPWGDNQNKEYTGSRQVNTLVQQWMNPKGEISDVRTGPKDYPFGTPHVQQGFAPAAINLFDSQTGKAAIAIPKAAPQAETTPATIPLGQMNPGPVISPTSQLPVPQQPQAAQTLPPAIDTGNTFSGKQQQNLNDSAYFDKTGANGKAMAMQYLKANIKDLESKLANSQGGSDMVAMKQRLAALQHVLQTN